jgi:DNA-binding MurR/RpiR family transcriptional regulator
MTDTTRTTIAETIRRHLSRLTPTERKPAYTLLANYPIAGLETVARFAARAGVSSPTILRFTGKLGFDSYAAFQSVLREELMDRQKSPLNKLPDPSAAMEPGDDFLDRFVDAVAANLRRSVKGIPRREFAAVVDLLANPRHPVYLLGGRLGDTAATSLYRHLRALRPHVHHIAGPPVVWPEYLLELGRQDILVVFDIRRYQADVIRFARDAAERRATVILFTDVWLSPVASVARYVFPAHIEVPSNWDSMAATFALLEALVAALGQRHWQAVRGRIETLEQMRAGDRGDG